MRRRASEPSNGARATAATLLALAAALAGSCSGPGDSAGAARPRATPASVRLFDLADQATVTGTLRGLDGDVAAPGASERLFRFEFDDPPASCWFDGAWIDELEHEASSPRHARATIVEAEGERAVRLEPGDGGLHRFVAADAESALLVVARVRAPEGGRDGGLAVASHEIAPPEESALAPALLEVSSGELRSSRADLLPEDHGGRFIELWTYVAPREKRRSLSLSLLPSTAGLLVDRLEVRRLSTASVLHYTPRLAIDRATHPLARVVYLVNRTCEALLVPAGASVAWQLDVPRRRPRFVFLPGAIAARSGDAAELVVRVDGEQALATRVAGARLAEKADVAPLEVDLARFAGRRVEVALAARSESDVVAFFGAPELLGTDEPDEPLGRRNLLLISLDTLRADHVGCYGDRRGLTPNLDALAAEGLRFASVLSPSSWTLPAHMSLMTGQHPIVHGTMNLRRLMDQERSRPLAARLRDEGWFTAAFTGGGPMQPRNGFGLGFESYGIDDPVKLTRLRHDKADVVAARAAGEVDHLEPALSWLRAHADQPFLLFVHTYVVHNYDPEPRFLAPLDDPSRRIADDWPMALGRRSEEHDAAALARLRNLYAATLAEADERLVGRLLHELDALGLAKKTVVCVVADHGEEHMEHGTTGHRKELYGESTRVPWILRGPGVPRAAVRDDPVELADVAPTLAGLLGIAPDWRVLARDQLRADPEANRETPRLLLLGDVDTQDSREALVAGPWKLMRWNRDGGPEFRLYRIDDDPLERHDLAAEDDGRLRSLAALLAERKRQMLAEAAKLPHDAGIGVRDPTPEELERLRDLGYVDH